MVKLLPLSRHIPLLKKKKRKITTVLSLALGAAPVWALKAAALRKSVICLLRTETRTGRARGCGNAASGSLKALASFGQEGK